MTDQQEQLDHKVCEGCGASVYPEHIESAKAGYWSGQLMCPICLKEKKAQAASSQTGAPVQVDDEPSIALVDEPADKPAGPSKIRAFGAAGDSVAGMPVFDDSHLARQLQKTGQGATRCRIFHSKLTDAAVAFMSQNINEWLDQNPEVEVKHVASTIGVWEGKHPEPHLILTLMY